MNTYSIVLDVWEGNSEMDETKFAEGNVVGLIIRLNGMDGGHHLDTNFKKQWSESQNFNPSVYFVYNPWVNGQANFDWLNSNMPANCPTVFIDTEVRMPNYPPATYGTEYNKFIKLCKTKWHTVIYTGAGIMDMLTPWPTNVEYWWAAWPYPLYPSASTPRINVTWDELRGYLAPLTWPPFNSKSSPAAVKLWQCSGDRFIVPGSAHVMDINVFPGTAEEYKYWLGYTTSVPPTHPDICPTCGQAWPQTTPPPATNVYYVNITLANVRSGPDGSYPIVGTISKNTEVTVTDVSIDYSKIGENRWVWSSYLTKK